MTEQNSKKPGLLNELIATLSALDSDRVTGVTVETKSTRDGLTHQRSITYTEVPGPLPEHDPGAETIVVTRTFDVRTRTYTDKFRTALAGQPALTSEPAPTESRPNRIQFSYDDTPPLPEPAPEPEDGSVDHTWDNYIPLLERPAPDNNSADLGWGKYIAALERAAEVLPDYLLHVADIEIPIATGEGKYISLTPTNLVATYPLYADTRKVAYKNQDE